MRPVSLTLPARKSTFRRRLIFLFDRAIRKEEAMKGVLLQLVAAAAVCVLSSSVAWAQATAQLNGRVADESGAVLPGVTVTATQTETGFTRTAVTDASGAWVMPNLPIGPYRLEIALQGFRTYVQTGLVLQVNANPVINASLGLGNLEETVTVDAAAPLVDVRSAGISEVVEQQRLVELPLQGRQVTDLIVLAGSAVNEGTLSALSNSGSVAISVAGGLRNGVEYTLDGAMHNNTYDNVNLPFPFPDALQEFRVATGGLSAENGMHSAAAVNAVVKSGTNAFHGNAFEFLRDSRFNATSVFAGVGADGKKLGDGLNRNQFGGTIGGPIVRDRLFFFGGYQRTRLRSTPPDRVAFVPTAAMLAGDFTGLASAQCNAGRPVALRAPFVNNRISPAQLSPAAVRIANSGFLPTSTDPCGEIRYSVPLENNDEEYVVRGDYQLSANHSLFGRYYDTFERRPPNLEESRNILTLSSGNNPNMYKRAQMAAFGDTMVFGDSTVNSFRVTIVNTQTRSNVPPEQFFDAPSLGINLHSYVPGVMAVSVSNAFAFSGASAVGADVYNKSFQASDDYQIVRGRHELAIGANTAYSILDSSNSAQAAGNFTFNGRASGLSLADFFTGQVSRLQHGAPGILDNHQWYVGLFAQDTWRATDRMTFSAGLRWEPYFGTVFDNGAISNFVLDNFRRGVKSSVYVNAPAGLIYPGDAGFPDGQTGLNTQWLNFSPRVGLAWDLRGDGRTALRTSYAMNYDYPGAVFQQVAVQAAPFNNRVDLSGNLPFEDPYRNVPGGQQHPVPNPIPSNVVFPGFGSYSAIDPNINSTRVQSWNLTVEQQVGDTWQASATYLGSYLDRLWGSIPINPGVFLGLGPCTLNGVSYPSCTTAANLEQRRRLTLENPREGQLLSYVSQYTAIGTQDYHGLKLSFRRRATDSLSLSGNYTLSRCLTDTPVSGKFVQFSDGYTNPDDPSYDRGNCPQNRAQIASFTMGYVTPSFSNPALRLIASEWRASGILMARSGDWLTVTTTQDIAGTGVPGQRVNQINDDPYGAGTLTNYLNPAAFSFPSAGTLGNQRARDIEGPGFWNVDFALARLLPAGDGRTFEVRVEAFNLFNHFNWGNPATSLDAGTFGRITSQAGSSRIMQFAVKYNF
jgi:hypothetical protein